MSGEPPPLEGRTFDVIIVGAGVIGAATAFYLRKADPELRILMIEQAEIGFGSTTRSFAAYRKQFRSRAHVLSSLISQREFERFEQLTGHGCGLRKIGYLFLYRDADDLERAGAAVAKQRELGVDDVVVLTGAQVKERFPFVDRPVAGATWGPSDGYLDPLALATGYVGAARESGVELRLGVAVRGLETRDGNVTGVRTERGVVHASRVILATGAWTRALAPKVPIAPVKRYIYTTPAVRNRDVSSFPMTILDLGAYVRSEARVSLALGWDLRPDEPEPDDLVKQAPLGGHPDYSIPPEFSSSLEGYGIEIMVKLSEVMSFFLEEEIGLQDASCGYYEITPDHRVVIDRYPDTGGLFIAAGASGHGIMHAPVIGMLTADLVLDRAPRIDGTREAFALGPLLRGERRPDPETMII